MRHSGLTQVEKRADSSFTNQSSGALKTSFPGRVTRQFPWCLTPFTVKHLNLDHVNLLLWSDPDRSSDFPLGSVCPVCILKLEITGLLSLY